MAALFHKERISILAGRLGSGGLVLGRFLDKGGIPIESSPPGKTEKRVHPEKVPWPGQQPVPLDTQNPEKDESLLVNL